MEKTISEKKVRDGDIVKVLYKENGWSTIWIIGEIKFLERSPMLSRNDAVIRYQYNERVEKLDGFDFGIFIETPKILEVYVLKKQR